MSGLRMVAVNGVPKCIEDEGAQTPEACSDRIINFDALEVECESIQWWWTEWIVNHSSVIIRMHENVCVRRVGLGSWFMPVEAPHESYHIKSVVIVETSEFALYFNAIEILDHVWIMLNDTFNRKYFLGRILTCNSKTNSFELPFRFCHCI